MDSFIEHYGIKGQKYGVRRFQNADRTWTDAGKIRYGKGKSETLFVSGSSKTQDPESKYYRKDLPKEIQNELDSSMKRKEKIVVGDAPGIDRQVQDYLNAKEYSNVEVYGPGKEVRYSANKKWKTNPIDDPEHEPYSPEWLRKKDEFMTDVADKGLAVILDEGAKATRNNVDRLVKQNKDVKVFMLRDNQDDSWVTENMDHANKEQPKVNTWLKVAGIIAVSAALTYGYTRLHKKWSQDKVEKAFEEADHHFDDAKIHEKYVINHRYKDGHEEIKANRTTLALDIKRGELSRKDLGNIINNPIIQKSFRGKGLPNNDFYNTPKEKWDEKYADIMSLDCIAGCFNEVYLWRLFDVSKHVMLKNAK